MTEQTIYVTREGEHWLVRRECQSPTYHETRDEALSRALAWANGSTSIEVRVQGSDPSGRVIVFRAVPDIRALRPH